MKVKPIGAQQDGVQTYRFLCPGCSQYDEEGSRLYAHHQFNSTWSFNGEADKPTVSPSILVQDGRPEYRCHSFIRDGRIEFLSDSSHALAGQTVDLPELP
jgi:hypothetical protein